MTQSEKDIRRQMILIQLRNAIGNVHTATAVCKLENNIQDFTGIRALIGQLQTNIAQLRRTLEL